MEYDASGVMRTDTSCPHNYATQLLHLRASPDITPPRPPPQAPSRTCRKSPGPLRDRPVFRYGNARNRAHPGERPTPRWEGHFFELGQFVLSKRYRQVGHVSRTWGRTGPLQTSAARAATPRSRSEQKQGSPISKASLSRHALLPEPGSMDAECLSRPRRPVIMV